jgi:hypothetical protein
MCIHVLRTVNPGDMHDFKRQNFQANTKIHPVRNWDLSPVIRHDNKHMSPGRRD